MEKKSLWETWTPEMKQSMTGFCEEYKQFMSKCKTERECVTASVAAALRVFGCIPNPPLQKGAAPAGAPPSLFKTVGPAGPRPGFVT